jgi:hypothetical protein
MEQNTKVFILGGLGLLGLTYLIMNKNKKQSTQSTDKQLEDFSKKRGEGAMKIAENAKEKGGLSMLTYYHFDVKEPYYKSAAEGKLDFAEAEKELKGLISEVNNGIQDMSIGQIDFQKKVGRIEVLGELLIEHK